MQKISTSFLDQSWTLQIDQACTTEEVFSYLCCSKNMITHLLENGLVFLNGSPISKHQSLSIGDYLSITLETYPIDKKPAKEECLVVYEDDYVYVVHKEPGRIIYSDTNQNCLVNQAALWQSNHNILSPVRYLHRLDKDTTGLVLFSKHPVFQSYFDHQLESHHIHRTYYAIVHGSFEVGKQLTIQKPIGKDRHQNGVYRISSTGKVAITDIVGIEEKEAYSLIQCTLQTGRTHQIRVHLSSIGYQIVNDPIYGRPSKDFSSMGLWAKSLTFSHPFSETPITVQDIPNQDYSFFTMF